MTSKDRQDIYSASIGVMNAVDSLVKTTEKACGGIQLPDWVKPGAKFRDPNLRSDMGVFTIASIDYDKQRVYTEKNNGFSFYSFRMFTYGRVEQIIDLPAWVKPGAKYRYADDCPDKRVFTITKVDHDKRKVFKKSGDYAGYSHFATFCTGEAEEVKTKLPEWVKPGVRYFMPDKPDESFKVRSINEPWELISVEGPLELGNDESFVLDFEEFLEDNTHTLIVVPDWVKIHTVLQIGEGNHRYAVEAFAALGVKVQSSKGSYVRFLYGKDFKTYDLHEAAPEKPKLPDWMKPGNFMHWSEETFVGPDYLIKDVTDDKVKVLDLLHPARKNNDSYFHADYVLRNLEQFTQLTPKLPDWMKPGVRFTFTWGIKEPQLHLFKRDRPEICAIESDLLYKDGTKEMDSSFSYECIFMNLECFKPVDERLPSWVKPGAKYRVGNDGLFTFTIKEVDYASKRVTVEGGRDELEFSDFYDNQRIEVKDGLKAPGWLKPGVWAYSVRFPGKVRHAKKIDLSNDLLVIQNTDGRGAALLRTQKSIDNTLKQVKITPWTAKQALEFLESGKKVCKLGKPLVKPSWLQVQNDGFSLMFMSSLESYDLRQLAEQFETEDHLPCGSW